MPKHSYKKQLYIMNIWKQIKNRFAKLLKRYNRRPASVPARKAEAAISRQPMKRPYASSFSRQHSFGRRKVFRIRDPRRVIIASGALVVVIIAVILAVTLSGGNSGQEALAGASSSPSEAPVQLASVTLVMPAYDPVQLTEGVNAAVVSGLQQRLMDLGYMDADETDNLFDESTALAVNHFKKQNQLTEDGIVDDETYSLLFSEEAQYYTLSVGAKDTEEDTDVNELQQRLVELGYLGKATGYYGSDTEEAVKKFQKLNNISQDGKIGRNTRELLYDENAAANFYSSGEKSDEILTYQNRLKKLGYLTTTPDGTFGPDTKEAVRRFQEANGLIADGYIGPATRQALMSSGAESSAFSIGSKGSQVTNIQDRLKKLGYLKSKSSGYFGSSTEKAVRSFQKTNKLAIDGKVGTNTMNKLMSSSAKKAPSGGSGGSGGGGGGGGGGSGGSDAVITGPNVESFISVAESKLGCRYVGGGKGPNVFDCSGFVYWCLNQVGIKQSYMTSYTWRSCTKYTRIENMGDLERGDVIVYKGHVAICAGSGYMIDASSHNKKVVKRKYTGSSYWDNSFICGFRVFSD